MPITAERSHHGVQPTVPPPLYQQHVIRQQQQQPQQQQPSQMPLFPQPHPILGPSGALPQLPQFASLPQPAGFVGGLPSTLPPQPQAMTGAMPVTLSQSNPVQMLYSVQVGPNGVPVLLPLGPQFGAANGLPQPTVLSQSLPQPHGQQLPQHFQAPPQLQVMQPPPMYTQAFAGISPAPTSSEHAGLRQVHSQYVGSQLRKPDSLRGVAAPPPQHVATGPATGSREVTVIDPTLHVGKVAIPYHLTLPTRGRAEWDRGTSRRDLSLCCLFQRGRCHAGDGCHQIHADREFVATMRERQAASVSCCVGCGDTLPARNPFCRAFFNGVNAVHVVDTAAPGGPRTWTLSPKQLAYTVGLQDQFTHDGCGIEAGTATVSLGSVCRLQRRGACKYGKDCKRVHVCSKVTLDTDGSLAGTGEDQFGVSAPAAAAAAVWEAEHEGNSLPDTHPDHSQGTYALDEASVDCYFPSLPVEKRIHRVEAAAPAGI